MTAPTTPRTCDALGCEHRVHAPIQLDGPYRNRRALRRMRWALAVLAALLVATPFVALAISALQKG